MKTKLLLATSFLTLGAFANDFSCTGAVVDQNDQSQNIKLNVPHVNGDANHIQDFIVGSQRVTLQAVSRLDGVMRISIRGFNGSSSTAIGEGKRLVTSLVTPGDPDVSVFYLNCKR